MLMAQVWFLAGFSSTLLKKTTQWCLGSSSFILVIDDMVALDCILNSCSSLCVPFYIRVLCLKNSASSNKEYPLAISCVMNLSGSSVTSSSCLSSSFLWPSNFIRSSLVSPSSCTARSSVKSSSCRSSYSFSLRVTRWLKASLDSSSTFSNPWKSWTNCGQRFFQTPFMVTAVTSRQAKSMIL